MKTLLAFAALLLCSCATDPNPTPAKPAPPKLFPEFIRDGDMKIAVYDRTWRERTADVRVFQQGEPLPPHRVVAFITAGAEASDEAHIVSVMIKMAQKVGATGVALLPSDSPKAEVFLRHNVFNQPADRVFRANAILLEPTSPPPGSVTTPRTTTK